MKLGRHHQRVLGVAILTAVIGLSVLVAAGCGSAGAAVGPLRLAEGDDGKTFQVEQGAIIEITLPGNATTGFAWSAALSAEAAKLVEPMGEPTYVPESTSETIVGSGGAYTLKFKAVAEGKAEIKLIYSQPWESVSPEQIFAVNIEVK